MKKKEERLSAITIHKEVVAAKRAGKDGVVMGDLPQERAVAERFERHGLADVVYGTGFTEIWFK